MKYLYFLLAMVISVPVFGEPSISDKIEQMMLPTVRIRVNNSFRGSGVILSSEETETLIITKSHLFSDDQGISVSFNGDVYAAEMVRRSVADDLALLRIELATDTVSHFHPKILLPFEPVFIVGSALANATFPTQGIVANPKHPSGLQVSAMAAPGSSGGGVWVLHEDHYVLVGLVDSLAVQVIPSLIGPLGIPDNGIVFVTPTRIIRAFLQ